MLPSELFQKIYSLFPNFFISSDVRSEWQELYKMGMSGIPSNHIETAYKAIMKRWTYPTPPKPGDFLKIIEEQFPKPISPVNYHIDPPPPLLTDREIDDRKRVGMLFKLFRHGLFAKKNPHEAKEFTDNFNKSPVEECEEFTKNYIANGPQQQILKTLQIEVTL